MKAAMQLYYIMSSKQVITQPDGRCDMRPESSWIITNKYHRKRNISADEMYSTICVQWAVDHFGVGLTYTDSTRV